MSWVGHIVQIYDGIYSVVLSDVIQAVVVKRESFNKCIVI